MTQTHLPKYIYTGRHCVYTMCCIPQGADTSVEMEVEGEEEFDGEEEEDDALEVEVLEEEEEEEVNNTPHMLPSIQYP